jgi:hypothetical protein
MPVLTIDIPQVRVIEIDADESTYASEGSDRAGEPVFVLTQARVTMPELPLAGAERAIVFTAGDVARRAGALMNQGEFPIRARAVFETTHWRVVGLSQEAASRA